mmetsp:Transcript_11893/g.13469  ORF Transcript_11893/g.13469 Transcript_11893/m.13469 type:complete len:266 (+) Transcript_11893:57-854(+)
MFPFAAATRRSPRIVRNLISTSRRSLSAATATSHQHATQRTAFILFLGVVTMTIDHNNHTNTGIFCTGTLSYSNCDARIPSSGDVLTFGKISNEPTTNIPFPALCNGMSLGGVGVRIKYVFVKVYAVGAYFDPIAMMSVKKGNQNDIERALINPTYPRTIRIVMNRALSVDKFIDAIVEAVEPRLKGKNLETLDEFKELFPKVDLVEGDEVELTIRGEVLLLKTGLGVGTIRSRPFTEAMCDVYFGKDAVSPSLKNDVLKGIPKL